MHRCGAQHAGVSMAYIRTFGRRAKTAEGREKAQAETETCRHAEQEENGMVMLAETKVTSTVPAENP